MPEDFRTFKFSNFLNMSSSHTGLNSKLLDGLLVFDTNERADSLVGGIFLASLGPILQKNDFRVLATFRWPVTVSASWLHILPGVKLGFET